MESISYHSNNTKLAKFMDEMSRDHQPRLIDRKNAEPVVMLSQQRYQELCQPTTPMEAPEPALAPTPPLALTLGRPAGMPWLSPYLTVKDAALSLAFYRNAFGFVERHVEEDEGRIVHVEMVYQEAVILFGPERVFGRSALAPVTGHYDSPVDLYVYCEDVDTWYNQALGQGARPVMAPQNMPWQERLAKVLDVDGYLWSFATRQKSV